MKVLHVFTIITTPISFFDGQFKFLSENNQDIHLVTSSEEDTVYSKNNELSYHQINISRSISPITDIKSIFALIVLIKRERYDIVVGHTPKGALVAMIASFLTGVKKRIYFRHGVIYTTAQGLKRHIFKSIEQFIALLSTNIVNVSASLSRLAERDKLNGALKQTVIGSGTCGGIDTVNLFNPQLVDKIHLVYLKNEIGIKEGDFVIGFCGRLCRDKGIEELVDAFVRFQHEHDEIPAKLLLIGKFDERDLLPEKLVNEIRSNPNIISAGQRPKNQLPLYYSMMDVFLFPSYREGFGMCVIEASAMEIPVLVSHSHGCEDALIDNVTGEYIKIDPEDISEKLFELYNNPRKRLRYAKNGRQWVCNNFERSVLWPKYLEFYENL